MTLQYINVIFMRIAKINFKNVILAVALNHNNVHTEKVCVLYNVNIINRRLCIAFSTAPSLNEHKVFVMQPAVRSEYVLSTCTLIAFKEFN